MKPNFALSTLLILCLSAAIAQAADITVTGSGNWSSTVPDAPWPGGIPPGTNDSVDIESPYEVTVNTNTTVGYLYGSGTATMAPGVTLTIVGDSNGAYGAQQLATLNATAAHNTVVYTGNAFWAKRTDYYNLVFTNATTNAYDFYNGPIPNSDPVAMTIGGDMSVYGKVKLQQGADFTINGNLLLGTNSSWDCSSFQLTVAGNTTVSGLLLDLDGALGSDYFAGNVTINPSPTGGWNVSDVTQWAVGGSLTNNGLIAGKGYGSIAFNGTGAIVGKSFTIPTLTVNGTYLIGATITLTTNTPTLNGTLVFDLAKTNQLVLKDYASNPLTFYYNGDLNVINSGAAPTSGKSYQFFKAGSYGGFFFNTSYPTLPAGLNWEDDLLTSGSLLVQGTALGSPALAIARNGNLLTLSWDSTTYPGFRVLAQTNGLGGSWQPTGSGTVSPVSIAVDPTKSVFFRLSNP